MTTDGRRSDATRAKGLALFRAELAMPAEPYKPPTVAQVQAALLAAEMAAMGLMTAARAHEVISRALLAHNVCEKRPPRSNV